MEQQIDINKVLDKLRQRLSDEMVRSAVLEVQLDLCRNQKAAELTKVPVPDPEEDMGIDNE